MAYIFQFTMSANRNEYQFKTLPRQFCRCGRTRHMGRESALKKSSTQFQKNPFGGLRCLSILSMNENKNRQAIRRDSTQVEYLFPRGKRRIAHILQISLISHISEISQIPLIFGQNCERRLYLIPNFFGKSNQRIWVDICGSFYSVPRTWLIGLNSFFVWLICLLLLTLLNSPLCRWNFFQLSTIS